MDAVSIIMASRFMTCSAASTMCCYIFSTLGCIEEFDGSKGEERPEYVERLDQFFAMNSIDSADRKRAVFLSVIGAAT